MDNGNYQLYRYEKHCGDAPKETASDKDTDNSEACWPARQEINSFDHMQRKQHVQPCTYRSMVIDCHMRNIHECKHAFVATRSFFGV